jgi:dipeptidyl aminopeptidase/acylaminoacyl peptidase
MQWVDEIADSAAQFRPFFRVLWLVGITASFVQARTTSVASRRRATAEGSVLLVCSRRPNPGVVLPHGGPAGETIDQFNQVAAALSSRGNVRIAPNIRGSVGYGLQFQNANHRGFSGKDLQDKVCGQSFSLRLAVWASKKLGNYR